MTKEDWVQREKNLTIISREIHKLLLFSPGGWSPWSSMDSSPAFMLSLESSQKFFSLHSVAKLLRCILWNYPLHQTLRNPKEGAKDILPFFKDHTLLSPAEHSLPKGPGSLELRVYKPTPVFSFPNKSTHHIHTQRSTGPWAWWPQRGGFSCAFSD